MESLRTKSGRRTAVLVALGLMAALLCAVSFVRNLPALLQPAPIDLAAYYAAARILNEGRAHELYDLEVQRAAVAGEGVRSVARGYIYPPFLAVVMRPLALLPFRVAAPVWLALNLALLGASARSLLSIARLSLSAVRVLLVFVFCLLLPPVTATLALGQINILLLFLLVNAALLAGSDPALPARERLAGLLIGAAAGMKLFPLVALVPLALRRRWGAVLWGLVAVAATVGVGIAGGGGPANTSRYLREIMPSLRVPALAMNQSIAGGVQRLLESGVHGFSLLRADNEVSLVARALVDLPVLVQPVTLALSTGVVLVTFCVLCTSRPGAAALDISLVLGAALLVLPLVWEHYHALLLLPWAAWLGSTPNRRQAIPVILLSVLALGVHRFWKPLAVAGVPVWALSFGLLAVLVTWLYTARLLRSGTA